MLKCELCGTEQEHLMILQVVSTDAADGTSSQKFCFLCVPRIIEVLQQNYVIFATKVLNTLKDKGQN